MDRRLVGGLLSRAGFEVSYAEHGQQALELLKEQQPDLVATDLQMPELDGLSLVEAIRKRYPSIPVLLMTAHGSEETAVKALQRGAASYVPKRSLAQDLCPTVANVLELARGGRSMSRVLDWLVYTESRFVLDNDVSIIPDLVSHLEASITQLKSVDETALIQVGVALREALVNAMYHGNLEVSSTLREEEGNRYDELCALRRGEAHRALTHQQRPLAHGARLRRCDFCDPHPATEFSQGCAEPSEIGNVTYMCVLHVAAE